MADTTDERGSAGGSPSRVPPRDTDEAARVRERRIHAVVEDCLCRRAAGEALSDEQSCATHSELMPELGAALRGLAVIERARHVCSSGPRRWSDLWSNVAPDLFPGYEVLREIHRGGQGIVYRAQQKSTGRKVALKVLLDGAFAGPPDRARFEREVKLLAALQHPNIVTIHDSGHVGGHFFFVMDYIPGQPLDLYISSQPRSIEQTLRLFSKVCDAVNAAHVRGVIHRDLKPANIRVDERGEPYILDFGLAKQARPLTSATGTAGPDVTLTGQFVGSLPWAAPEQADGSPTRIDTRSDVYALGVVLYQMLTTKFPYNVAGPMHEVVQRIVSEPPLAPHKLRREIDDELETILLKCLAKERERRYQTAGELGRDVEAYLRGEPLDAKRDSGWYVLRKTLNRYRFRMATAAAFVLLVTAATIALSILYAGKASLLVDAERERDRAVAAQRLADDRLEQAEHEAYLSNIAAAAAAITAGDGGAALKRLQSTNAAQRNWEWHYLLRQADQSVATWYGPKDLITGRVRLSRDGRYVAASFWMEERESALRVWPRTSSDPLGESTFAVGYVTPFEFLGDGEQLLVCDRDGTLSRLDLAGWRESDRRPVAVLRDGDSVADFWPQARVLLTAAETYRLWDTAAGQLLHELPMDGRYVWAKSVDATGARLALGLNDGTVVLWDVLNGRELAQTRAHSGMVYGTAFSPDGRLLATASEGGELKLWELAERDVAPENPSVDSHELTLRLAREFHSGAQRIGVISFSPDGRLLAAPSEDKTVRIWNVGAGELRATLLGHTTGVVCTSFGNDGRWLLSGARDGVVKLWDLQQPSAARAIGDLPGPVGSIAFTPDGTRLLVQGKTVCVVDIASGRRVLEHPLLPATGTDAGNILAGPGDSQAAFSDVDGSISIWDISADGQSRVIGPHKLTPRLAGSRSRGVLASADAESLVLWDWVEGRELRRFAGPSDAVRCLALSPDATRVALGLSSGELVLQDAQTGQLPRLGVERAHSRTITSVAFSPDGRVLVTGSDDGSVKLWDVDRGGAPSWTAAPQLGDVWCVALSPDGTRIAAGGRDRSVRVFDARDGQELLALRGPTGTVMCVAFSPDGERIAAGSWAREIFIWDAGYPVASKNQ